MDILPLPGTDSDIVTKKHCLMMIDVGWFQIGSTCLSIIRFLATAFWIVEPVVKETNCAIHCSFQFLTYLQIKIQMIPNIY